MADLVNRYVPRRLRRQRRTNRTLWLGLAALVLLLAGFGVAMRMTRGRQHQVAMSERHEEPSHPAEDMPIDPGL